MPGILAFYYHHRPPARLVRDAEIGEDYIQMEKLIAEIRETVVAGKHNDIEALGVRKRTLFRCCLILGRGGDALNL